jgi:hypothetical protein
VINANAKGQFVVSVENIYLGTVISRGAAEAMERIGGEILSGIPQTDRDNHQVWTAKRVQSRVYSLFRKVTAHHSGMVPYTTPIARCVDVVL